ncbi:hypothetical protein [Xanthomonas campestris]|uniref:hypothetical protein n=1 Tax=Xanthomonas campestris TaxID=339 RepID=UPI0023794C14|nr:hypothetical protein [Xanthomonas campestris]WDJ75227.1 hypothetical protein JH282_12165 [Xanthomonas campestris pv. campestris]
MPITAFSKQFNGEFDVVQLLSKLSPWDQGTADPSVISQATRETIARDVVCPGCGAGNAKVVVAGQARRGAKRTVSQSHFRFDDHKPFCEFEDNATPSVLPDHLVDFRASRSAQTRLIGKRVSQGIELEIFSQGDMRRMRQWFLELRITHSYRCEVDEVFMLDFLALPYRGLASWHPRFHPSMRQLPNFNSSEVASTQFIEENPEIFDLLEQYHPLHIGDRDSQARVISTVRRNLNQLIYDPSAAKDQFSQVRQLANLVAGNEVDAKWRLHVSLRERTPQVSSLTAFCALLLFSHNWDMDKAVDAYVRIRTSGEPVTINSGNIIGLNPFYDYDSWRLIAIAHQVKQLRPSGLNTRSRIEQIRQEFRAIAP